MPNDVPALESAQYVVLRSMELTAFAGETGEKSETGEKGGRRQRAEEN